MEYNKQVKYIVKMSNNEFAALHLLSNRVRNCEEYAGGSEWRNNLVKIIGEDLTDAIANMFKSEEE